MTLEVLKALVVILEFCANQDSLVRLVCLLSSVARCPVNGTNQILRFVTTGGPRSRVVFHERKVSRI